MTHGIEALPWWKGAVIYQIYPRSFKDSNGDGIGDLPGILAGLEHIASLGVDGIWIGPFFTSPMKDYGYDVADYCDVDPIFGTLADFDAVLARAKALGLKVIIDQVYSHTSDAHAWFSESRASRKNPKADWYVWADPKADGTPPNNWQSVFGGPAWEWDARRGQYFFHNFLREQPDLNLYNPDVQAALLEAGRFWLDRGVDGFRLDALNFGMHDQSLQDNPPSGVRAEEASRPYDMQLQMHNMSQPGMIGFIERFAEMLKAYPEAFTVAEIACKDPVALMKAYTQGDARLSSAYNFDFLYAPEISPARVKASLAQWDQSEGEGWPSWAFSNHDAPRAVSRWAAPDDRDQMARVYMLLLLSLRGNPILYQGEELGLPQGNVPFEHLKDPEAIANWPKTLGRDGARTPMVWQKQAPYGGFSSREPWLPIDPAHLSLALDQQEQQGAGSMLSFTQWALEKRRESAALKWGSSKLIEGLSPEILAIEREWAGETSDKVLALFNYGQSEAVLPESLFPSGYFDPGQVVLITNPFEVAGSPIYRLPPQTAMWLRQA